jgi:hypothetical protein
MRLFENRTTNGNTTPVALTGRETVFVSGVKGAATITPQISADKTNWVSLTALDPTGGAKATRLDYPNCWFRTDIAGADGSTNVTVDLVA